MLQHGILLEKKLNFLLKTTRQNKKNGYTAPPPNFLQTNGYLRCRLPIFKKAYFKEQTEKLFSKIIPDKKPEVLNNNKFVQQIKTTNLQLINIQGGISLTGTDAGDSKLARVLLMQNSKLKNVQGCTFFSGCLKDWDNSIQKT